MAVDLTPTEYETRMLADYAKHAEYVRQEAERDWIGRPPVQPTARKPAVN